ARDGGFPVQFSPSHTLYFRPEVTSQRITKTAVAGRIPQPHPAIIAAARQDLPVAELAPFHRMNRGHQININSIESRHGCTWRGQPAEFARVFAAGGDPSGNFSRDRNFLR